MTWKEAISEVAKRHRLGSTLVTGHKAGYFEEAAELYAQSKISGKVSGQKLFEDILKGQHEVIDGALRDEVVSKRHLKDVFEKVGIKEKKQDW